MGFSTPLFAGFVQPFCAAWRKRTVSSGILTVSLDLAYVKLRQMRSKLFLCHINKNGYASRGVEEKVWLDAAKYVSRHRIWFCAYLRIYSPNSLDKGENLYFEISWLIEIKEITSILFWRDNKMDPSEESTSKSPEGIDHSLPCSLLSLLFLRRKKCIYVAQLESRFQIWNFIFRHSCIEE